MNKFLQGTVAYCKDFWFCLINTGVNEYVNADDRRYIKFANVVAALTAVAIVSYVPGSLIHKNYVLFSVQLIDLLSVLSVLWLNFLGYHRFARQTYMAVVNVFVLINACVIGFESRVHDFFYFTYVLPFLLFRVKDYRNIISGILMAVVAYNVYTNIYMYFTQFNLSLADQMIVYNINIWMKFILFGIGIYILAYYNHTSETQLAAINEKLHDQTEELKRSNEDLEQFAYIVSHDLKAPVRNIGSFMKLLSTRYTSALPPDAKEFVEMSKVSAERLARQIDDLLSYCRVGRNLPPVSSVDLNEMVRTIRIELNDKIREVNADVKVDGYLPTLNNIHSSMIHHVFQNLIANGIKFNTTANPEVKVSCVDAGAFIQFSVSDNGIGIDKGFESKLFQMFKRLHTQDKFEGTGIGLAVCKKIVTFYDGEIWYESTAGQGTTFNFTLPKYLVTPSFPKHSSLQAQQPMQVQAAA